MYKSVISVTQWNNMCSYICLSVCCSIGSRARREGIVLQDQIPPYIIENPSVKPIRTSSSETQNTGTQSKDFKNSRL